MSIERQSRELCTSIGTKVASWRRSTVKWEHAKKTLEKCLMNLEGDDQNVVSLRRNMLLLEREVPVSLEDLIIIRFGALEYGVYYDAKSKHVNERWSESNCARNSQRTEVIHAIELLINCGEFPKWNNMKVKGGFVTEVVGSGWDRVRWEGIGYRKTLERMRLCYEIFCGDAMVHNKKWSRQTHLDGNIGQFWKKVEEDELIKIASERFTKKLKNLFGSKYLDEWCGEVGCSNNDKMKMKTRVTQYNVCDEACVWHLENVLSGKKLAELKDEINNLLFMNYYEGEYERSSRLIRVSAQKEAKFLVGRRKDTKVFGSVKCGKIEEEILKWMSLIVDVYRQEIEIVEGVEVKSPDLLQLLRDSVDRGGYGSHSDDGGLVSNINVPMSNNEGGGDKSNDVHLQIVISMVLSNVKEKNTKVIWVANDDGEKKVVIKTGDNEIHFQAIFVQSKAKHEVQKMRLKHSVDGVRIVVSGRASLHLQKSRKMIQARIMKHVHGNKNGSLPIVRDDYQFSGVWNERKYWRVLKKSIKGSSTYKDTKEKEKVNDEIGEDHTSIVDSESSDETETSDNDITSDVDVNKEKNKGIFDLKKCALQNDTFRNAKWDDEMNGLLPVHPIIKREPHYEIGGSYEYYKPIMQENCFYEVTFNNKETITIGPWLDDEKKCTIHIGDSIDARIVRERFHMRESSSQEHANDCWSNDGSKICGLLLELDYKNDVENIQKILENKEAEDFFVCLRGGGATVCGDTTTNNQGKTNKESGQFPTWQKLKGQNVELLKAALRNIVLPIFIIDKNDTSKALYLGFYFLDGFYTARDKFDDLKKIAEKCCVNVHEQKFMRFREMNHVRISCKCIKDLKKSEVTWRKLSVGGNEVYSIGAMNEQQGKGEGATRNVVSLNHPNAVSLEQVRKSFVESKSYMSVDVDKIVIENDINMKESEIDEEEGETVTGLISDAPGKQIAICIEQLINFVICCSVAVFSRMLRLNISKKEEGVVGALRCYNWMKRLGGVLRYLATPHPIRSYDTAILALIVSTNSHVERQDRKGLDWIKNNEEETKELLFAAIFATFIGRTSALEQWCKLKKTCDVGLDCRRKQNVVFYPKRSEIKEIIHFMKICNESGKNGMTKWKSEQFAASLPAFCNDVEQFSNCMEIVIEKLGWLCERIIKILENKHGRCKREEIRKCIKCVFRDTNDKKAQSEFIANQILLNFEEVVDVLPNVEMSDCHLGYGSKTTSVWVACECSEKKKVLQEIVKSVKKMKNEELKMVGLYRDEKNVVRVILNKRIMDVRDAEHLLCKLWIVMARVVGKRPSINPKLSRPHLHPLRIDCAIIELLGSHCFEIAKDALEKFETNNVCIPALFEKENKMTKRPVEHQNKERLAKKRRVVAV